MADDVEKLLRHIGRSYLGREQALEIERDANAENEAADIVAAQRRAFRDAEQRASDMSDAFRAGLQRAEAARRAGGNAISLDDRKPDENSQADALIHFLVRSELASSTSRETDQHRYIYTIAIDWDALNRTAQEARINLSDLLGRGS